MVATDKTEAANVEPMARVFYTNIAVVPVSFLFWIPVHPVLPNTPALWGQCLLIGVMLCMAVFLLNLGIAKIGAGTASFINMAEPVVSMVFSIAVFGYSITFTAIVGCLLILGSMAFAAKS